MIDYKREKGEGRRTLEGGGKSVTFTERLSLKPHLKYQHPDY